MKEKRTELQMLGDFTEGLNIMIDAASQMVHHRINPKFMAIRDMLNMIKDDTKKFVKEGL